MSNDHQEYTNRFCPIYPNNSLLSISSYHSPKNTKKQHSTAKLQKKLLISVATHKKNSTFVQKKMESDKRIIKKIWLPLGCIIISTYIGILFINYYSAAKQKFQQENMQQKTSDTLRVAIIGDSWAERHYFHQCRIDSLIKEYSGINSKTVSFGISGLTSKEVYNKLYRNTKMRHILEVGTDYCVIMAGVNDTNQKMSTYYYKESMLCIIDNILKKNIIPIIIEIPDYNTEKALTNQKLHRKILRYVSMAITGTKINCKQQFRDALDELIQENNYQEKVSIIRYISWNNNYEKDLNEIYTNDQMHLNEKGYAVLDSVIAKEILAHLYKSRAKH